MNLEHTVQTIASPSTLVGGAATVFLGLNVDEWGIVAAAGAFVFTIAGFAVNWYYKHKQHTLQQRRDK